MALLGGKGWRSAPSLILPLALLGKICQTLKKKVKSGANGGILE